MSLEKLKENKILNEKMKDVYKKIKIKIMLKHMIVLGI